MDELKEKLQQRQKDIEKEENNLLLDTLHRSDEFIESILKGKYCKKCLRCGKRGEPIIHHPNVVTQTEVDLRNECQYAVFQRWLDYIVIHKCALNDEFKTQLKTVLKNLGTSHNRYLPPLEWYYCRIFDVTSCPFSQNAPAAPISENVKRANATVVSEEGLKRWKTMAEEDEIKTKHNQEEQEKKEDFISFFKDFYLQEYDQDVICNALADQVTFETPLSELYFDDLGRTNLVIELYNKYARGQVSIPENFFRNRSLTVGDVYKTVAKCEIK